VHEDRPAELGKFLAARARQRESAELLVAARRRLAELYAKPIDEAAKREQKAGEFARLREALVAGGHTAGGDFNNARLVAVATYERCVPPLRAELDRLGNDLPAFYAAMKALERDDAARERLCPRG
jgi:predicted aminopeptidase